ncbi:nucleotidyltransferase family protein [Prochlorococcus sp. MIT 1307]|uniref:nucleotidyltransferase family protein n=1 Tax=Prochlorococcus sp. MIT 1307 TaxID=3096219 RepID=UPI002A75E086|nr:nucleotidyltransferase family protein [Prochlorococcus sp. MIT 1307]
MKQFEQVFIPPSASLIEAISVIDKGALQVALIVDKSNVLLGVLTDGDIRKALLDNRPLTEPVEEYMTKEYKFVREDSSIGEALEIMRNYSLMQIPVLDKDNKVIEIRLLSEELGSRKSDTPVVIMAGGKGKRLIPYTNDCPKPMLKIGEKPILEIIMSQCIDQGFREFYLSVNYLKEQIIDYFGDGSKWNVSIKYLVEESPLGTAGSLYLIQQSIKESLLIINGDILTNFDLSKLVKYHKKNHSKITLCARQYQVEIPFGVVETDGIEILNIVEKPTIYNLVSAGVYVIEASILKLIPSNRFFDMPDLLLLAKKSGEKVIVYPIHEYWLDIGKPESLEKAYLEWNNVPLIK